MAAESKNRVIMPTDLLYLLTFTVGMAAFWISGRVSTLLPAMKSHALATNLSMAVTAGVYGLGMLLLTFAVTRRFGKPALVSTLTAVVLGLVAARVVLGLAKGHIHTTTDVALFTFVLYLVYGGIYALGLAAARKIAK